PVVDAGPNQSIALPDRADLSGSVIDDGLPLGSVLNILWTKVSGPGTVTFENAAHAVTAATFSLPGTYVLQLSASDGQYTINASVLIIVNPGPAVAQGWIGAPLDGATVTGQFAITVAPGVTLTGGTLVYYPVSNANARVTLNANTTGSGQLATLDTTLLANGA